MSLLKLHNIGKIYSSNDILTIGIRNVNLEFDYNEFVTIEGESGSGKSTLLNVIGANDTYEEGEIYFNGSETSHFSENEWEKYREENIATIFQDFNIIENLTVLENVELALLRIESKVERKQRATELIEKVGLIRQINQKGSQLSGGEKQRTVIARALAKDSPIILADEPTGNLDVKSSKEVAKLLKDVSKDKLVIVVTHNPEYFIEYATRRVRVYDGHISEDKVIQKTENNGEIEVHNPANMTKKQNIKNTLWLGLLNYKSRPKFAIMMTFAMFICAVTLFVVLSLFSGSLIQSYTEPIDSVSVNGKVIISSTDTITIDELDIIAGDTNADYILLNREKSIFNIHIEKTRQMLGDYTCICMYSPFEYNVQKGEAVLVIPYSIGKDADVIKRTFIDADVGIENIKVVKKLSTNEVRLYLSGEDIEENGNKIMAIN